MRSVTKGMCRLLNQRRTASECSDRADRDEIVIETPKFKASPRSAAFT
jgi:hypothetical protein